MSLRCVRPAVALIHAALLVVLASCSSRESAQSPGPAAKPVEKFTDPPIELPIVVNNEDVGAAMHTQAVVFNEYDAWCKQRGGTTCSRMKRTGDDGIHEAEAYRHGNDVYLAIATMNGWATAVTPIRLAGEPDAVELVVSRTEGGIPVWDALLTVRQGRTWYVQVCSWSGDPEGCTLPVTSQVESPRLDGTRLVVRRASVIHDGTAESIPDQTYVLFVP